MGRFLGSSRYRSEIDMETLTDVSSAMTLVANRAYSVNTTSSTITLTLPQYPAAGDYVEIIDAYSKFDTNNCIINVSGDGSSVGGYTDNLTLDIGSVSVTLQYSPTKNDWIVANLF